MARGRGRRGPDRVVEPVRDGFAPGGSAVGHVTGGGTASWRGLGVGLRRWGWDGGGGGGGRSLSREVGIEADGWGGPGPAGAKRPWVSPLLCSASLTLVY